MYKGLLIFFFLFFAAPPSFSHDLQYRVSYERAVVIDLFFTDDMRFSYEIYEVYAPDEKIPFQKGRTDKLGRISLLPNKEGVWRIKAFSEDGHGLDFTLKVGEKDIRENVKRPLYGRYMKVITGIGIIMGIFGIIMLFFYRRAGA